MRSEREPFAVGHGRWRVEPAVPAGTPPRQMHHLGHCRHMAVLTQPPAGSDISSTPGNARLQL